MVTREYANVLLLLGFVVGILCCIGAYWIYRYDQIHLDGQVEAVNDIELP